MRLERRRRAVRLAHPRRGLELWKQEQGEQASRQDIDLQHLLVAVVGLLERDARETRIGEHDVEPAGVVIDAFAERNDAGKAAQVELFNINDAAKGRDGGVRFPRLGLGRGAIAAGDNDARGIVSGEVEHGLVAEPG